MPKKSPVAARRVGKPARSKKSKAKRASYPSPHPDIPAPSSSGTIAREVSPRRASSAPVVRRPVPILPSEAELDYVMRDLSRIVMVAGSLMVVMVALAFLIK